MSVLAYAVLIIYSTALIYITMYCVMQFNLLYHYKKAAKKGTQLLQSVTAGASVHDEVDPPETTHAAYPFVTVQLPIFNEMYVVERLIDNIAQFDYPKDRFEIHVLDDSTDESVEITSKKVAEWKAQGIQIEHIHRVDRKGYKAGALQEAMQFARGEFIAIFDADFLPRPDFLKVTIPYFNDSGVGVVQTRWEHINEDYSLITKLQALQLNVHFTVEQKGREAGNYLLQFNGTAGVWRRQTIEEAGGWEADTLTEDLDLSIRAQLKGWKIKFLEEIGSPAELPAEMSSLKSQQFRWMKGGAETAKKMLPTVWKSNLTLWQKIQTTVHLLSSTVFVFVFIAGVFSVPLLFVLGDLIEQGFSKHFFAWFMIGLLSIIAVYYTANLQSPARHQEEDFGKSIYKFIFLFPLFLALSMGLSLHNTVAVIQGYRGKKSPFVRTPKFNIQTIKDTFTKSKYLSKKLSWTTLLEGFLALYFLGGVIGGILIQNTTFLVFHFMLSMGYGAIFYFTLRHLRAQP
ncbi:MAG TPA: glycosyltransferase family 2 protein [Saprospiraceae bacterium]|nr:glycosyltransferase family 2 protein [Saprospiraceae bacterium]